jgi:hypothetical protein
MRSISPNRDALHMLYSGRGGVLPSSAAIATGVFDMSDCERFDRSPAALTPRREDEWMPGTARAGASPDYGTVSRDPVDNVVCRVGDGSCASAHAGVLNRSKHLDGASFGHSLLRLQRQYGNQYVGQVLSRASTEGEPAHDMSAIERSIDVARGGGHAMDHGIRTRMEGAFGADFSGVRIHTDNHADALNRSLSARAFATGRDVFFRQGEYNPGSSSGRELLAHELTHVVQQNGDGIHRKMTVSQPGDPHEVEADQMARAVIEQEHAQPAGRQVVSRAEEEEKDKPVAARRAADTLQRQPEAPRPQDDEEKKKLHAKTEQCGCGRSAAAEGA